MPAAFLLFRNYSRKIGHLLFLKLCRHNRHTVYSLNSCKEIELVIKSFNLLCIIPATVQPSHVSVNAFSDITKALVFVQWVIYSSHSQCSVLIVIAPVCVLLSSVYVFVCCSDGVGQYQLSCLKEFHNHPHPVRL